MNIRERIAYELLKPRRYTLVEWLIWLAACIVVAWGFVVCVLIISSVIIVIFESWIL